MFKRGLRTSRYVNQSIGLVNILNSMQGNGYALIVYELMDGDLNNYKEMGFGPELAIEVLQQISQSLLALFRLGVSHRDIKPANIL